MIDLPPNFPETILSSWAEIHGLVMGLAIGLLLGTVYARARRWLWASAVGLVTGLLIGLNVALSPWSGWWHVWYILGPAAVVSFLIAMAIEDAA